MKYIIFFLMFLCSMGLHAQSLQNFENNPTFKGITIGMSVKDSTIVSKIKYIKTTSDGYLLYEVTDRSYYSIFNISVDSVRLSVKAGRVYAIELIRTGGASEFKQGLDRLQLVKDRLTKQWGKPLYLKEIAYKKFTRLLYFCWESTTKKAEWYIDYYGALVGHKLTFTIKEHEIDF